MMENQDIVTRITRAKNIAQLVEYRDSLTAKARQASEDIDAMNLTEEQISEEVAFYQLIRNVA